MVLKVALIGAGKISRQHLGCLRRRTGVELAAICDLSPALAEMVAERYGARSWFTDHRLMLAEVRPDVIHVTTPPETHFSLAQDALEAGAHVIVEKPAAVRYDEVTRLISLADRVDRKVVENYNYIFSEPIRRLLSIVRSGEAGTVHHIDVTVCLDITKGPFADPNLPHPALSLPGGAITDFLPHLASLAHAFVGPHRAVSTVWMKSDRPTPIEYDEMRALVIADGSTASLTFSSGSQPDVFSVRLYAERLRAAVSLFEPSLIVERVRNVPKPLVPTLNGLHQSRESSRAALTGLLGKLTGGPGSYEGLWELLAQTYLALEQGSTPPVTSEQIVEVNRLLADLVEERHRL